MYPYFQSKWKDGKAVCVIEVLTDEDNFDSLVHECFGVTSEEYFESGIHDTKNARVLNQFISLKGIETRPVLIGL